MSVFNYIDSFFFISLGITFVLILLLVFHFKQRTMALEQKSDTMFEILNTMLKELAMMKAFVINQRNSPPPHSVRVFPDIREEVVALEEEEDSGEKEDSGEEEGSGEEEDSGEEDSEEEGSCEEDSEEEDSEEEDEHKVKVVQIDLGNISELPDETIKPDAEIESEPDIDTDNESVPELDNTVEPIVVEKLEEENVVVAVSERVSNQDMYRAMTASELKNIVFSKGLATSVGKLKKHELLKILESDE